MAEVKLPEGWVTATLNDVISDIKTGKSIKCDERVPVGSEKGLIKISAVTWGRFDENESKTLIDFSHLKPEQKIKTGDFLISRANTIELVGSCVIVEAIKKELYLSDKVLRLEMQDHFKPVILNYLRTNLGRKQIEKFATGNQLSMRNISQDAIRRIKFPLPPLAEQKIIAERLDSLLAQVATIKTRLDAIPTLLKRFRQSVLSAAVSGKLTEEWRRNNGVIFESWFYEKAENVCLKVQSGSTPRDNPFDQDGTVPFLKVYNIVNQQIDFDYKPQFITEEVHSQKLKRSVALPDDVLMNIVGPPLGKVALLTNQYPEWNVNQAITIFRVDPKLLNSKYLYYVLCEGGLVREVVNDLKGIVGQINISLTQCRESIIPCPTIEEQTEIVRRVEKLFAYAESVGQQVAAAQSRVDKLTQAILAKAFSGELTADWRAAHPELISGEQGAAALLARIQAERAASAKPGRKPKSKR